MARRRSSNWSVKAPTAPALCSIFMPGAARCALRWTERRFDLKGAEAIVFDPPRAGAREQAVALAESKVQRIVYVSCNPATFARDARTLVDGGYDCLEVTPIDQFLWTPHIELVAHFVRRDG